MNARYFLQTVTIVNFQKQCEVRESRKSNQQCQHTNLGRGGGEGRYDEVFSPVSLAPPPLWHSLTCAPQSERIGLLTGPQEMPTPQASFPLSNKPRWHNTETVTQVTPYFLCLFFSNYNIPGVLSPSPSVNGTVRAARSYGSISGMRSGSFQRSNSNSNLYIPGTTPPQLFSAGSGYQPSTLVEQNEG